MLDCIIVAMFNTISVHSSVTHWPWWSVGWCYCLTLSGCVLVISMSQGGGGEGAIECQCSTGSVCFTVIG